MSNQPSPETLVTSQNIDEITGNLTEEQRELVGFYEHAQWMPDITPELKEAREQELEAADMLAREAGHEDQIPLLRFVAQMQIENAKRIAGVGQSTLKAVDEPMLIDEAAIKAASKKGNSMLPGMRPERALAILQRMGVELADGGRGSHQKIYYPETGVTTVFPVGHKGQDLSPGLLRTILGQLGIPADKFKTYI